MKKSGFNQYYDEAVEPGKRERAYAWATAIGLQDVDGLKPSKHLLATARRHIDGEITQEEARRIVDEYYETKDGHDLSRDTEEADRVSAHPFREGNTRTTAVFAIKYLRTKGFDVTNDLFAHESWYFRNALVRANYENAQLNVTKTTAYLEDFFKVLLLGEKIELKNRFLRIGFEYGSKKAERLAALHREKNLNPMGGNAKGGMGGNVGGGRLEQLPRRQNAVCQLMLQDPSITAAKIAEIMKVRVNTIEKRIAILREKGSIVRVGGTRGVWKVLWR